MESFRTKITALMMVVLSSLLLLQISSVDAVDVMAYASTGGCSGSSVACFGIPERDCCFYSGTKYALRVRSMGSGQRAYLHKGYRCNGDVYDTKTRDYCWYGYGPISGCHWVYYRSTTATQEGSGVCGLPETDSATCNSTTLPNAVTYSAPGSSTGTWVLHLSSDKVDDTLEQLDNVPVDQKVAWLQSAGAHLDLDVY